MGNGSLVIGHWSLVIGHWSLVIGHWSLVIVISPLISLIPLISSSFSFLLALQKSNMIPVSLSLLNGNSSFQGV
ncbi:hypothetical protein HCG51_08340 [Tolypothrix sp. PCC 7910]|nr:hypothetical protein HCG51_08340 [Tolypothrix sp. PCC 7910]